MNKSNENLALGLYLDSKSDTEMRYQIKHPRGFAALMNKIPQKQDLFARSVWLENTSLALLIFIKTSIFKWNTSPRLSCGGRHLWL